MLKINVLFNPKKGFSPVTSTNARISPPKLFDF